MNLIPNDFMKGQKNMNLTNILLIIKV